MLVVFTKQTKIPEITEGSGGYVQYLAYGDGITGVFLCLNTLRCIHYICPVLLINYTPIKVKKENFSNKMLQIFKKMNRSAYLYRTRKSTK